MSNRLTDIHTHDPLRSDAMYSLRLGNGTPPGSSCFSAAVHPWDAERTELWKPASEYLNTAPLAAVGETGLDFAAAVDREAQLGLFHLQLGIASRRGLPVVLHCVRAFEETMRILRDYKLPSVVFHGFVGNTVQMLRAAEAGYYLSFGERSFRSPRTVEAMRALPAELLLLESDESPLPIETIYDHAAALLGTDRSSLAAVTEANFNRMLHVPFR